LSGTRKVPVTSVAIIDEPCGRTARRGWDRTSQISFANGNNPRRTMITAKIERRSRVRNSIRCEMKVSCGASSFGSVMRLRVARVDVAFRSEAAA